jgi:anaerobic ribonucleoside-triphosphate reductase activating protein
MEMQLYSIAYPVTALGPGRRAAIWLAGCHKRCEGCISPEMQDFKAGRRIEVAKLLLRLSRLGEMIEGITISGGEPFEQPDVLDEFLDGILEQMPGWNVIVYTGYELPELAAKGHSAANILKKIDILIDGEYKTEIPSDHPLKGSGNQQVHFLTQRGISLKQRIDTLSYNEVNLGIGSDSRMLVGIVDRNSRSRIHKALGIK